MYIVYTKYVYAKNNNKNIKQFFLQIELFYIIKNDISNLQIGTALGGVLKDAK